MFKLACAYVYSDDYVQSTQSSFPHEETFNTWLTTSIAPIKDSHHLRGCAGWWEFSMGAHANMYFLLDTGSIIMTVGLCTQIAPNATVIQDTTIYLLENS